MKSMNAGLGSSRRGSVLILTAFGALVVLGFVALVTDVGWMYFNKNRLQTGVNAAWKSGYDELNRRLRASPDGALTNEMKAGVTARAKELFTKNGFSSAEAEALEVEFVSVGSNTTRLEVRSNLRFGLFFGYLINFPTATAYADRGDNLIGSGMTDDGGEDGIIPIGVMHGEVEMGFSDQGKESFYYRPFDPNTQEKFVVGREYLIRLGNPGNKATDGGSAGVGFTSLLSGNSSHGSLDLDRKGGGGNEYRSLFVNGYKGPLNINQRLNLKTGQMDNPVDQARSERNDVLSQRRVIVPIVDLPPESKSGTNANCLSLYDLNGTNDPVRITGFAVFDLIEPEEAVRNAELGSWSSNGDGQLRGKFVQYVVCPYDIPAGTLN